MVGEPASEPQPSPRETSHAPSSPTAVTEAIAAFDTNDVPVSTAVEHGVVDVDRAHVMRLRRAGTREAGDTLVAHLKERGTRARHLLELDIRSKLFPVEHAFAHLACAPQKKKFAQALAVAQQRSRLTP